MHKTIAMNRAREVKKRNVTVGDLTAIAGIYEKAAWWRRWFDVVVDHRIPIAKGGTHEVSNLQIIYRSENAEKLARLDYNPKVVFLP